MSSKGTTITATTTISSAGTFATTPVATHFPFAQYASVLGVHLLLLGFTAIYLPQMARVFTPLAARKTDRPQSEFVETLTADPLATLGWIAAGLVLLQPWWAGWVRKWSFEQMAEGSDAEIKLKRARFNSLHLTRLKDATVFTLCVTVLMHIILVMFGAPITSHIWRTAFLAFVFAILTAFTPAFVLGPPTFSSDTPSLINRLTWARLFAELAPKNMVECVLVGPAAGTFVGGWLGAIPIALDWDCPWQAWPLTPLFGSIAGYSIGALVALASNTAGWLSMDLIRSNPPKSNPRVTDISGFT